MLEKVTKFFKRKSRKVSDEVTAIFSYEERVEIVDIVEEEELTETDDEICMEEDANIVDAKCCEILEIEESVNIRGIACDEETDEGLC